MAKIARTFEIDYEIGDVVIFKRDHHLNVGIIEDRCIEDDCIGYKIRMSEDFVYTYTCLGFIVDFAIVGKLDGKLNEICVEVINERDEILKL